jgi:hypothetical protein
MRSGDLGVKTVRVHSNRELLRRVPTEGICLATGKVRYRSPKLAKQVLALARKMPGWSGVGSTYRCSLCPSHHVTHLPEGSPP